MSDDVRTFFKEPREAKPPFGSRRAPLRRGRPLRAKPDSGRTPEEQAIWERCKAVVWRRCDGNCEALTPVCTGRAEHPHHRLRRGQGGPDVPTNILAVAWECHDWIHTHIAESEAAGWLIRSTG